MNTPLSALLWEFWRKNRWGIALVVVLFASCVLLRLRVQHLQADAAALRQQFVKEAAGSFAFAELAPAGAETGPPINAEIKFSPQSGFFGPVSAKDKLSWRGEISGGVPLLRFFLNEQEISEPGVQIPGQVSITISGKTKRSLNLLNCLQIADKANIAADEGERFRRASLYWSFMLAGFAGLMIFAIFGAAEPNSIRGFTGLPPRQFTLPVPTWNLLVWPVALGALAAILNSLAWTHFVFAGLISTEAQIAHSYFALLVASGLAVFQALVWSLPAFPKTRVALLALLVLLVIGLTVLPLENNQSMASLTPLPTALALIFCVAWSGAVAAAWIGVNLERRGRWVGWIRSSILSRALGRVQPAPFPFSSAFQAQLWMEWRRNGRLPLWIWVGVVWLILATRVMAEMTTNPTQLVFSPIGWSTSLIWFCIWAGLTGLNLARDGASKRLSMSAFTAARPLKTGELVQAKILMGWFLWLAGLGILGAGTFLSEAMIGNTHLFDSWSDVQQSAILVVISLHVLVGILPLALHGRLPGFPWSLLPLLLIYGLIFNGFVWIEEHPNQREFLFDIVFVLLLLKVAIAFWGFRRSIGLRLTSLGFVAGYGTLWLAATGGLMVWTFSRSNPLEWNSFAPPFLAIVALSLPLARVALSPLALDHNRHR